ncbi:MAG: hypothetical protein LBP27_00120 [Treponema sp.]|jgi:hypothetical protein|nr:hypothetical protein [Treponema sp.]
MKKIWQTALPLVFAALWAASCTLEASTDSPAGKAAVLPAGMPAVPVCGPEISSDGTTTTLTYRITGGGEDGFEYTAKEVVTELKKAKPQSIEALILYYGQKTNPALIVPKEGNDGVTTTEAGKSYSSNSTTNETTPFVILPLDTGLVRKELLKKFPSISQIGGEAQYAKLVWIEENAVGVGLGATKAGDEAWKDGVYEKDGIRVMGLAKPDGTVVLGCDIGNFDDGGKVDPAKDTLRPLSIATVLVKGDSSVINFYAGSYATEVSTKLTATTDDKWANPENVKDWMKTNRPALRVVYEWAD